MKQLFTRMAVLLAAFGFLYSCTTVNHLQQAEILSDNQRFAEAYESAVMAVDSEPENPEAHLLRADIGVYHARNLQPAERLSVYKEVENSLQTAFDIATGNANDESILQRVIQIRNKAYNYEFESALVYTSDDVEARNPDSMIPAIPHLKNALAINPLQKDIYETLTNVLVANYFYKEAAETLEKKRQSHGLNQREYELTGFLHYQAGNYDRAVSRLQQAWQNGLGSSNAGRGLANAFRKTGDTMSEREILEQLVEIEPENIYNHIAYGKNLMEEAFASLENLFEQNEDATIEQLEFTLEQSERIISVFEQALQLNENHILANISAGLFYRNFAFSLNNLKEAHQYPENSGINLPNTDDYLYKSLNYLEHASERDPNQPLVWNALWPVYEALGMQRQADEAKAKAQD